MDTTNEWLTWSTLAKWCYCNSTIFRATLRHWNPTNWISRCRWQWIRYQWVPSSTDQQFHFAKYVAFDSQSQQLQLMQLRPLSLPCRHRAKVDRLGPPSGDLECLRKNRLELITIQLSDLSDKCDSISANLHGRRTHTHTKRKFNLTKTKFIEAFAINAFDFFSPMDTAIAFQAPTKQKTLAIPFRGNQIVMTKLEIWTYKYSPMNSTRKIWTKNKIGIRRKNIQ